MNPPKKQAIFNWRESLQIKHSHIWKSTDEELFELLLRDLVEMSNEISRYANAICAEDSGTGSPTDFDMIHMHALSIHTIASGLQPQNKIAAANDLDKKEMSDPII